MNELVALHTQSLREPAVTPYVDLLAKALRGARLNSAYPDRRGLVGSVQAMSPKLHEGLYDQIYLDSRTGMPNMAAFSRVNADAHVAAESLGRLHDQATLDRRRDEADVFVRLAAKRRYLERLQRLRIAPLDEHRVLLRRHDPSTGTAQFRIDLTKLDATGNYIRVNIDLTQVSSLWRRQVIDLDHDGETAAASQAFHATVYRYAAFDAETLFLHMHDIEGVKVERVQRGVVGPVLFRLPGEGEGVSPAEPSAPVLARAFERYLAGGEPAKPEMLVTFQNDLAALDVKEERSNDPLSPLLSAAIGEGERARYEHARRRFLFRVFKDRKFVVTPGLEPVVRAVCEAAGTKNITYRI